jgi:septal ring factor EnvC (AmiA/AmiB activator)
MMSSVIVTDSDRDFVSYIPPINRSVVQELDRSLRDTLKVFGQSHNNLDHKQVEPARDIAGSVDAVERAATLIGSLAAHIRELEQRVEDADAQRAALRAERDAFAAQCTLVSDELAAQTERRALAEALNKEHETYAQGLAGDLAAAHADIERLTGVIAQAFGSIAPVSD